MEENILSAYKEENKKIRKQASKRFLIIHILIYIFANTIFVVQNLWVMSGFTDKYYWFLWPLICWGIILIGHAVFHGFLDSRIEKEEMLTEYRLKMKSLNSPECKKEDAIN